MKTGSQDATAASSTAVIPEPEEGFEEFRKEQAAARAAQTSVALEKEPEVAPASERVESTVPPKDETVPPKQEALTDEEKSARKHANDEKRIPKLYERLSEKDAEIARLNRELAAKGTSAPPAKETQKLQVKTDPNDPAPDPKDPKYAGEDGWLLFVDDRSRHGARQVIKADREQQTAAEARKQADAASGTFNERMSAYREAHAEKDEEFLEAFTIVREALETEFPAVSSAIAAHEKAPELIDYLGTNLVVFSRITSAKGQPMAMKIFKGILADFEKDNATPVPGEQPRKDLPRPPVSVVGRGRSLTGDELQDKAAEDDDFEAWQRAERAKGKKQGRR